MSKRAFIFIVVAVVTAGQSVFGQIRSRTDDPQTKPRKERPEPDKGFTDWLRDVGPIISQDEENTWKKLRTNEERERFIEDFWRRRDPDPDTEENEYREAYYERIAYVNEHFSSGVPGYKTDRGRIYLKYGKPDEIESHPAGGAYERDISEGGGTTSTYPFERWFYRNIPGRSGAQLEFVDPTSTGEYRLARNPFEKDALLHVPGAAPTTTGVSQAELVAAASGIGNPFSFRDADSPFSSLDLLRIVNSKPDWPKNDPFGATLIPTPNIEDNPLSFEAGFGFFKFDDNRVITTITLQADNTELSFHDSGGIQVASANIFGQIMNLAGRRVNFFEDVVTTTATREELLDAKSRKSAYQKTLVLPPGHYKADLMVRDTKTGATGMRQVGFTVPKFGSNLAVSSALLCSVLQTVANGSSSRQFMIGDQKVIPNISGRFHQGSPVGLYLQIYNAGTDQTTLRPAVDVKYVLLKDGKQLQTQTEDWRSTKFTGERLTLSRLIDSRSLAAGSYTFEVHVHDQVTGQSLLEKTDFTIVP
jgi:GWxTD domain-containing protein